MKEQGEACCTLDHVCRRGCVPPTSEPRARTLESRNGQQENHIRSPPKRAITSQAITECIRYSDSGCNSFYWRERFVWLGEMGEGTREKRLSLFDFL